MIAYLWKYPDVKLKVSYILRKSPSQVKESDRIQPADKIRSDSGLWTNIRIPSVGIRRNLSVGFDRPLLLISSFNKLVPGVNFKDRSKPPIGSVGLNLLGDRKYLILSFI